MASRMGVTSLMSEDKCYQTFPVTAKAISHRSELWIARKSFLPRAPKLCQYEKGVRTIAGDWSERRDSNLLTVSDSHNNLCTSGNSAAAELLIASDYAIAQARS